MRVLAIGDVVGQPGRDFLLKGLRNFRRRHGVDFCVVNGENAAVGNGLSPDAARDLFDAGADVITGGNHSFQKREVYDFMDECEDVLRPANYAKGCPGRGSLIFDVGRFRIFVANLSGRIFLEADSNPFACIDALLADLDESVRIKIIDFHAEATSEKMAMAHHLDGRASLLFGTHTHVQTADACIFEGGLGYMTDLGMTGPFPSVLGLEPAAVLQKFKTGMPQRFQTASTPVLLCGLMCDIDEQSGRATAIRPLRLSSWSEE